MTKEMANVYESVKKRANRSTVLGRTVMITGNWALQGIWYMDRTERWVHLSMLVLATYVILSALLLSTSIGFPLTIILAFLISHTLNWILDGHFWALMTEVGLRGNSREPEYLLSYGERMKVRLEKYRCFDSMMIYGSVSRDEARMDSDLDVRLVASHGLASPMAACILVTLERMRAFAKAFPLDVHVVNSTDGLEKMRRDEKPIVLFLREDHS